MCIEKVFTVFTTVRTRKLVSDMVLSRDEEPCKFGTARILGTNSAPAPAPSKMSRRLRLRAKYAGSGSGSGSSSVHPKRYLSII